VHTVCADCGALNPEWAAINLGILICIEVCTLTFLSTYLSLNLFAALPSIPCLLLTPQCSGTHRRIGVHITKVRSLTLDDLPRTYMSIFKNIGSVRSNEYWECRMPSDTKIT
jgi:hypothetical protein